MSQPAVIATGRLVLRPHRADDYDAVAALWSDPDVVRHIGGVPSTAEESWHRLLRYAGQWVLLGYGFWAVEEQASGRMIGDVGLFSGKRGLNERFDSAVEAGWVFSPAFHGQGYAREAMTAALGWADVHLAGRRITCMIDPGNAASLRLAAALGFVEVERTAYKDEAIILFERKG